MLEKNPIYVVIQAPINEALELEIYKKTQI
jgi:hypothetical protein